MKLVRYGEAGGERPGLVDADGMRHEMTNLLGHATSFAHRKLHLGYSEARLLSDSVLGKDGVVVRGHEFHYASAIASGSDAPLAQMFDGEGVALGPNGGRRGHVTGAFFHAIATA